MFLVPQLYVLSADGRKACIMCILITAKRTKHGIITLILDLGFILTFVSNVYNEFDLCSSQLLQLVAFIANELRLFRHRRQLCSSSTDIISSCVYNLWNRCSNTTRRVETQAVLKLYPSWLSLHTKSVSVASAPSRSQSQYIQHAGRHH